MKIAFLFLCFSSLLFGEIKEIRSMAEIEKHLDPEAFLLFDLDNTIMETAQTLGSDQWFHYRQRHYLGRGFSSAEALEMALAEWMAIQNLTRVKLVESKTRDCIAKLQAQGKKVMGLTTRGLGLATRTLEQLLSLGVDLSLTAPLAEEKLFMNERGVLFRKGVIFSAGTNKGKALLHFLKEINETPKKIIFIDDKEKYLREVEESCSERKIPFLGLRYSFLDEKVKSFSPELAALQWEHFGKLISDEAAGKLLEP